MKKLFLLVFLTILVQQAIGQYSFNANLLIQDLKSLSSEIMEGRKTGTEGNRKARVFIIDRLKKIGIDPFVTGFEQSFSITQASGGIQGIDGTNILGVIPGKKKETIVISAHYDHLGNKNNKLHYGADDNASGVAALLAFAEYFKKNLPEHRLIFAFFDAEELGLRGAAHFVNSIDLAKENIVLNINMDMISRSDKNELYACGTSYYPQLKEKIESIQKPDGIKLLYGHDTPGSGHDDWTPQSDQGPFHQKKIPFVYFGVEDHADYHQPGDTFDKINTNFYSKSAETILQAAKALDKGLQ